MNGFHVTFYEYLDSILKNGLIPKDTNENNFPHCDENHGLRVFFMNRKFKAHEWYRVFHPKDFYWDEIGYMCEEKWRDSVIIEFELPYFVMAYPDPYRYESETMADHSFFVEQTILPEWIVDIHDPELRTP